MFDALDSLTQRVAPADARWTLRAMDEVSETLTVRQGVAEAPQRCRDTGVMVSVSRAGGLGHAATADTTASASRAAVEVLEPPASRRGARVAPRRSSWSPRPTARAGARWTCC
jgi:predicted Zn-dependent protease